MYIIVHANSFFLQFYTDLVRNNRRSIFEPSLRDLTPSVCGLRTIVVQFVTRVCDQDELFYYQFRLVVPAFEKTAILMLGVVCYSE